MKQCPKCSRVYADNSLRFCLDDGSALVASAAAQPTMRISPRGTAVPRTEVLPVTKPSTQPAKSIVPWVIAGAAIVVAGVVIMASLGILMFARKPVTAAVSPNANKTPVSTPKESATIVNLAGTHWNDTYENIVSKSYYFSP